MSTEIRRQWPVIAAAGTGVMLGISSLPAFVLGVFAGPMTGEFGWSLGEYQIAAFVFTLGVLLCSAWIGGLCDRHGARAVALWGMPLAAVGVAGFSLVQAPVWTWYLAMLLSSILASGTLPGVWTRMINALFDRQRGLALGLVLSGNGAFAIFGPPLAQWLIDAVGWRYAWLGLALLPLLFGWPVIRLAFRGDDRPLSALVGEAEAAVPRGIGHRDALRNYRFWVMVASFAVVTIGVGAMNPNLVPMLGSKGFAPTEAAAMMGILGVGIAIGRLGIGFVIDRVWAPGVAAAALSLPAISAYLLTGTTVTREEAIVAVLLLGFAQGAEYDFLAFLVARYFGMVSYGRIYGMLVIPIALATGVGAVGMGYARDMPGSFDGALPIVAVLFVAGGLALLTLGRYPESLPEYRGKP